MIYTIAICRGNASLGPYDRPNHKTAFNPDCDKGDFAELLDRVKVNGILTLREYLKAVLQSDAAALKKLQEDCARRAAALGRREVGGGSEWIELCFQGPEKRTLNIESGYEIDLGAEYRELVAWLDAHGVNLPML